MSTTFNIQKGPKPKNIPAFLKNTYNMLQNSQNESIVQWSSNGIGFIILNEEALTNKILPKYFKHSNYCSFIRQLNMYDFHKIRKGNIENYFHHDKFIKGNIQSIREIKRKPEKKKMLMAANNENRLYGTIQSNNYVLMGDYADRKRYSKLTQGSSQKQKVTGKTQITLNSDKSIKPKSQESIILNNRSTRADPIYYEEGDDNYVNNSVNSQSNCLANDQIKKLRNHGNINQQRYSNNNAQGHHNDEESLNQIQQNGYQQESAQSAKMSINNEIQHKQQYHNDNDNEADSHNAQNKQILVPSHSNIFHFVNAYQLGNFGIFM